VPVAKKPPTLMLCVMSIYELSYHGMRAKNKTFHADIKTDFDKTIGNIYIIPGDFGRALLNLFNNAFYAVNEKNGKAREDSFRPFVHGSNKK
jgi:hypothetical protein